MSWIPTDDGAVNAVYVVRVERDGDGSILHLRDGTTVRTSTLFAVVNGQLKVIEPDEDDAPF